MNNSHKAGIHHLILTICVPQISAYVTDGCVKIHVYLSGWYDSIQPTILAVAKIIQILLVVMMHQSAA